MTEKAKYLQLEEFGFGPNIMKKLKVCTNCGKVAGARSIICSDCGTLLPFSTLFDSYKRRHPRCSHCSTILTPGSKYCSHCGRLINAYSQNRKEAVIRSRRTLSHYKKADRRR